MQHTGAVVNGIPVFCGGTSTEYESRCYKLDKATHTWDEVQIPVAILYEGGGCVFSSLS